VCHGPVTSGQIPRRPEGTASGCINSIQNDPSDDRNERGGTGQTIQNAPILPFSAAIGRECQNGRKAPDVVRRKVPYGELSGPEIDEADVVAATLAGDGRPPDRPGARHPGSLRGDHRRDLLAVPPPEVPAPTGEGRRPSRRRTVCRAGQLRRAQAPRGPQMAGGTRHPAVTMPFRPAGYSWRNMVEILLGIVTRRAIRRGIFAPSKTSSPPSDDSSAAATTTAGYSPGP
jgi:hypothetical protein